jgi:hypothetical protein
MGNAQSVSMFEGNIMPECSHRFKKCRINSGHRPLYNRLFAKMFCQIIVGLSTPPSSRVDEASGAQLWQLVPAIHDDGHDGLILCE